MVERGSETEVAISNPRLPPVTSGQLLFVSALGNTPFSHYFSHSELIGWYTSLPSVVLTGRLSLMVWTAGWTGLAYGVCFILKYGLFSGSVKMFSSKSWSDLLFDL